MTKAELKASLDKAKYLWAQRYTDGRPVMHSAAAAYGYLKMAVERYLKEESPRKPKVKK